MTAKTKTVQVADMVLYQGRSGVLPALVLMTPETFNADHAGYEAPAPDSVSLLVFRINGQSYVRHGVPQEGSDAHKALLVAKATQDADPNTTPAVPVWDDETESYTSPVKPVVVRSWKFQG